MAIGQGAHKPCLLAFGADQFDAQDPQELKSRSSFFNWWYFGLCAGPLAALLVLNYIQDNISWGIGFGIPCIAMAIALAIFMLGTNSYRYHIKTDQKRALSRVSQVFIKAAMNWRVIPSTSVYNDEEQDTRDTVPHLRPRQFNWQHARDRRGKSTCQPSTLFTKQGITMDRSIGSTFDVPAASLQYIIGVTIILFIPTYDRVFVPLARIITGTPTGITKLQRIGTGLFLCTLSIITAALVERKRLKVALSYGLADSPNAKVPMSFWWLIPQYIIYGIADVFTLIGLQELFYDQMPCGLKAVGLSIYLSILGVGSFLSSFLIYTIQRVTSEGGEEGWFSDNTNRAHLDYFYWLLGGLNVICFLGFLYYAKCFNCTGNMGEA
ncbi:hypothetical protein DH2020_035128 [Rehmannia glutinosa]|uniref:Uncharacterized protein n=1 Tax=Rehmannia glutinosa TaxID=99300 RepID=A0ABR0VAP4_REHGL